MKKLQQISDSELEIMRIIWSNNGSALFAEIMTALNKRDNPRKPNTILTFLARLIEKNFISTVKHGRVNEYVALVSEQDYIAEQTKSFINKVYGGNAVHLISSLLKRDYITSSDMEKLKNFWEEGENIDE